MCKNDHRSGNLCFPFHWIYWVPLVNKSIQVSVNSSPTDHLYTVLCSPPQVKSPSITIYYPYTLLHLAVHWPWQSVHCCPWVGTLRRQLIGHFALGHMHRLLILIRKFYHMFTCNSTHLTICSSMLFLFIAFSFDCRLFPWFLWNIPSPLKHVLCTLWIFPS